MNEIEREVVRENGVDLIAKTQCDSILIQALRGKNLLGLADVDRLVRFTI